MPSTSEPLRYTLLGDGSSDRCLLRVINWTLRQSPGASTIEILDQFVHRLALPGQPTALQDRLQAAMHLFPCDVLFIHRDAEGQDPEQRHQEIREAAEAIELRSYVPVVPVRMTEAWLLIDEHAIRAAAGNPHGRGNLSLPASRTLESIPDPKQLLYRSLETASEYSGRRLVRFKRKIPERVHRVASLVRDLSPLRTLAAFRVFEERTREVLAELHRTR